MIREARLAEKPTDDSTKASWRKRKAVKTRSGMSLREVRVFCTDGNIHLEENEKLALTGKNCLLFYSEGEVPSKTENVFSLLSWTLCTHSSRCLDLFFRCLDLFFIPMSRSLFLRMGKSITLRATGCMNNRLHLQLLLQQTSGPTDELSSTRGQFGLMCLVIFP